MNNINQNVENTDKNNKNLKKIIDINQNQTTHEIIHIIDQNIEKTIANNKNLQEMMNNMEKNEAALQLCRLKNCKTTKSTRKYLANIK